MESKAGYARKKQLKSHLDEYRSLDATVETINGLFKAEVIYRRRPWRSLEAGECATLGWVDWFNTRRLLKPIWNMPPTEADATFYAALDNEPMAA